MDDHDTCRETLRRSFALIAAMLGEPDMELTISTAPPIVEPEWGASYGCTCPHGVTFWLEPTGDQLAKWRAERTP